jgi:hypothetical protein
MSETTLNNGILRATGSELRSWSLSLKVGA